MFHVAMYIPFSLADAQQVRSAARSCAPALSLAGNQVERKRHAGNDVVVIVFRDADCTAPFNPRIFKSQFNRPCSLARGLPANADFGPPRRILRRAGRSQPRLRTPLSVCAPLGVCVLSSSLTAPSALRSPSATVWRNAGLSYPSPAASSARPSFANFFSPNVLNNFFPPRFPVVSL